jgi:riboflavin synthase
MFTGLIRELATVISFSNNTLTIKSNYKPNIGDSIAINGACLTVVGTNKNNFSVEISPQSQKTLALKNFKNKVHIEPAMMMGDRFEGHIVQGHIDCVGEIVSIKKDGNSTNFDIKLPQKFIKFLSPKGSITIDGVSLTIGCINENKNTFTLTIIPHTIKNTLFQTYKIATKINIETDMFARYVYNLLSKNKNNLSWDSVDNIMANY